MIAIKTCNENKRKVGHLPREDSQITKLVTDDGTKVKAELIGSHSHICRLVKNRSEIPCKVSVSVLGTCVNLLLLEV